MEFTPKQLKEVSLKSENESEAAKEEDAVQAVGLLQNLRDDQADFEMQTEASMKLMLISLSTINEANDFLECQPPSQLTQLMSLSISDMVAICKMEREKEMKERAENLSKLKDTITKLMAIQKKFAPKQLKEVSLKSENESEAAKEEGAVHDDLADVEMLLTEAIQQVMLISLSTMNEAVGFLAGQPRSQLTQFMSVSKTDVGAICKIKMEKEMKERAENLSKLKDTITKLMAKKENIQKKFAPKQLKEVSLKSETESEAAKEEDAVHDDQADVEMLKEVIQELMLISLSIMNEALDFLACQPRSQLTQLMSLIKTDVGAICKMKMEKEMKERAENLSKLKDTITKLMAKKENIQEKFAPKQLKEVSLKSETESEAAKEDAVHDDQAYFEMQTEAIQQLMLISLSTMNEAVDFLACTHHSQLTQLMSLSKTDVGAICKMKMEKDMKERAENFSKLEDTIIKLMAKKENIQKKMAENSLLLEKNKTGQDQL